MDGWTFEKIKGGENGFIAPNGVTVSQHMLRSAVEWSAKVAAGEANAADFAKTVAPMLPACEQFLGLGFDAKAPVQDLS